MSQNRIDHIFDVPKHKMNELDRRTEQMHACLVLNNILPDCPKAKYRTFFKNVEIFEHAYVPSLMSLAQRDADIEASEHE